MYIRGNCCRWQEMKISKLPIKLLAEPLLDAVCEVRFEPSVSPVGILPGVLFREFGSGLRIQQLPISQIPQEIRASDPALAGQPLIQIVWDDFSIAVGDRSIQLSCLGAYPGWQVFKKSIQRVMTCAMTSGIVNSVERFSLKYSDLLTNVGVDNYGGLDLELAIGGREFPASPIQIRTEFVDDSVIHIIQCIIKATATVNRGGVVTKLIGSALDVDTVSTYKYNSVDEFLGLFPTQLDDAHMRNKRVFFECLTEETLTSLGPVYE